jgi:predicted DNA-binding transcriptional regulator AlpA
MKNENSSTHSTRGTTVNKIDDDLMSVDDIIQILNISRDTFYKWRQTRKGPRCFPLPNGELRCKRSDFVDWLNGLRDAA